ncbi:MAG: cytochrome b/b6 domain-containing protein [Novosphingobium sp.]
MKSFRIYHILLGLGALAAWFTAEELGLVHAWTGYVVAALLIVWIVPGLAGASGFHLHRLLPRSRASGAQGQAISSALALALVIAISGTAATGIAMDGGGTLVGKSIRADDEREDRRHGRDDEGEHESMAPATMLGMIPAARADGGEDGEREEGLLGEVHETLGNLILPLAVAHALYLLLFRLQMAKFMLFLNRKRAKV